MGGPVHTPNIANTPCYNCEVMDDRKDKRYLASMFLTLHPKEAKIAYMDEDKNQDPKNKK